ncbi:type I secretion system permease/ATPase [Sulfitobacter sp. R18_1]|uniref:type I secretion system permease/ATPase n=1 Tax=Sulfitobacter sp. R18_1 TaxID=2821104 RepID=UPI001ADD0337|nr:type I secretion system permease/ATPase [Sulfitobacter sp. R18_1]MBO9427911.1 type I secretion system permease/ATPase [Sulfitobacter sp. R18_1]
MARAPKITGSPLQLKLPASTLWIVGIFSLAVNMLLLAGPIYMLQVYDRVLGSRSEATLVALTAILVALYGFMASFDYIRGRLLARMSAQMQQKLDPAIFRSDLLDSIGDRTGPKDIEMVQKMLSSPVFVAFFDLPWTPVFLAGIAIFHPALGVLALVGGAIIVALSVLNQASSQSAAMAQMTASSKANMIAMQSIRSSEDIQALGMRGSVAARWTKFREEALAENMKSGDRQGGFLSTTKALRLFLQSAMLGLGAYLVLLGELTPGAMIAGSILLGRALQPVEQIMGQWQNVQQARTAWTNIKSKLSALPVETPKTDISKPTGQLKVASMTIVPPGNVKATLAMIDFEIPAGTALGVIGTSGSGKSTLARAITGVWKPAGGRISMDGWPINHFDGDVLGRHIGYLSQQVVLFDGTIAQNIARMEEDPDPEAVLEAARKAGATDLIQSLPQGFDTPITSTSTALSGGQMQRIALARALYGNPSILVLDEPNSNLDQAGIVALNKAVAETKKAGGSIIIMAHRPSAIEECDLLLVLDKGRKTAFGPRDEVLKSVLKSAPRTQGSA